MRIAPVGIEKPQLAPETSSTSMLNQDFMTLLVAQLRAQDPLEPMRTSEFTGQLAQLQTVAEISSMNLLLMQLIDLETLNPVLSLLDREVEWLDPASGERMSGPVERVALNADGGYVLVVGDHELSVGQVLAVS